jgi:hypothetical protein
VIYNGITKDLSFNLVAAKSGVIPVLQALNHEHSVVGSLELS